MEYRVIYVWCVWILLFMMWLDRSCVHAQGSCLSLGSCSCILDDGKIIDVTSLGRTDGTAAFSAVSDDGYRYLYNPCKPFNKGTCKNAATCQVDQLEISSSPIGDAVPVGWSYDGKNVLAFYSAIDMFQSIRSSFVTFICDPRATTPVYQALGETEVRLNYFFEIRTVCACPDGCSGSKVDTTLTVTISTGSVLVIIFFVLLVVYLVAGIIFNRVRRQAQGLDMIPNLTIWQAIPGLIKDGFVFTFSKIRCGGSKSYNEI